MPHLYIFGILFCSSLCLMNACHRYFRDWGCFMCNQRTAAQAPRCVAQAQVLHEGGGVHYGTFPGAVDAWGHPTTIWVVNRPHNWRPKTAQEYLLELDIETGKQHPMLRTDLFICWQMLFVQSKECSRQYLKQQLRPAHNLPHAQHEKLGPAFASPLHITTPPCCRTDWCM